MSTIVVIMKGERTKHIKLKHTMFSTNVMIIKILSFDKNESEHERYKLIVVKELLIDE